LLALDYRDLAESSTHLLATETSSRMGDMMLA
jgi:hypothetical protein